MARCCLASILIVSTTLGYFTLTNGHDWGDDFAQYLLQAQSLSRAGRASLSKTTVSPSTTPRNPSAPTSIPGASLVSGAGRLFLPGRSDRLEVPQSAVLRADAVVSLPPVRPPDRPTGQLSARGDAGFQPQSARLPRQHPVRYAVHVLFGLSICLIDKFIVRGEYLVNRWISHTLAGGRGLRRDAGAAQRHLTLAADFPV